MQHNKFLKNASAKLMGYLVGEERVKVCRIMDALELPFKYTSI